MSIGAMTVLIVAAGAGQFGEGDAYLKEIGSAAEFQRLSIPENFIPGVERSTKFLVPVRDQDPNLLPVLFQNVNRYLKHEEFLRGEFPEKFGGLSAREYTDLVEHRATRQWYYSKDRPAAFS